MATITLLEDTGLEINKTGEKTQADGFYGFVDGLHTVAIYTQNLQGRVYIEASLAVDPQEDDWFPIHLGDKPYVQFPQIEAAPTGLYGGDTATIAHSFRGNYLWIRARLDRSYMPYLPDDDEHKALFGSVRKVLMAR